jgi:hypothetical protein
MKCEYIKKLKKKIKKYKEMFDIVCIENKKLADELNFYKDRAIIKQSDGKISIDDEGLKLSIFKKEDE